MKHSLIVLALSYRLICSTQRHSRFRITHSQTQSRQHECQSRPESRKMWFASQWVLHEMREAVKEVLIRHRWADKPSALSPTHLFSYPSSFFPIFIHRQKGRLEITEAIRHSTRGATVTHTYISALYKKHYCLSHRENNSIFGWAPAIIACCLNTPGPLSCLDLF